MKLIWYNDVYKKGVWQSIKGSVYWLVKYRRASSFRRFVTPYKFVHPAIWTAVYSIVSVVSVSLSLFAHFIRHTGVGRSSEEKRFWSTFKPYLADDCTVLDWEFDLKVRQITYRWRSISFLIAKCALLTKEERGKLASKKPIYMCIAGTDLTKNLGRFDKTTVGC